MQRETRLARRALVIVGAALAALGLTTTAALADDWGPRVPGKHVYDLAGALTAAQLTDLEQSAAAVDQAGAPAVVYLRSKAADDATTRQDARALMDAWAVESSPGQKDGFVLLLNLRPGDGKHGSAALVAGESNADRLDDGRLQGIYTGTMAPRLAAGDLAGALTAALDRVAADLRQPAPVDTTPPEQSISPGVVAGALLGFGAIGAVVIGLAILFVRRAGWSASRPPGRGWYAGDDDNDRSSSSSSSFFTGADAGGSSTFTGGDGGASSGSSSGGGSF